MELTPARGPEPPSGVNILVVDAEDDDDFYDLADQGQGEVVGRVVIRAGQPFLDGPGAIEVPPRLGPPWLDPPRY